LSDEAAALLARQPWRGNVRELRNFMFRVALLARVDLIDEDSIEPLLVAAQGFDAESEGGSLGSAVGNWLRDNEIAPGAVYDAALAAFERPLFEEVLRKTGGNQLRAAQHLGINRNTLRKRLTELDIDPALLQR
jgi:two-component system nitrogen regulation response regulator GlnG